MIYFVLLYMGYNVAMCFYVMLCFITCCYDILCYVMMYHVLKGYVMIYYALLWYLMLCSYQNSVPKQLLMTNLYHPNYVTRLSEGNSLVNQKCLALDNKVAGLIMRYQQFQSYNKERTGMPLASYWHSFSIKKHLFTLIIIILGI